MNDANQRYKRLSELFERDMFWLKELVSNNVLRIGYIAMIAFVGHKSLGWPDFGITQYHLLGIAVGGALLTGLGTFWVGRRSDARVRRELRHDRFSEAGSSETLKDAR